MITPMSIGERTRVALISAVLFGGTVVLYARTFGYGFVNYDDPKYVTENPHVQAGVCWDGIRWAFTAGLDFWQPLPWLSHQLDWSLFGPAAGGHHLTSVLWHAVTAVLAFFVFRRLLGSIWRAAFGAAWFAWHPLRVESVAWITERKDVISGCFFLLTVLAYAKYVAAIEGDPPATKEPQPAPNPRDNSRVSAKGLPPLTDGSAATRRKHPARRWAVATVAAYAAGLMSKPMLVTVPVLLLVLDWWPFHRWTSPTAVRRLMLEKTPLFALAAAAAVAAMLTEQHSGAFVIAPSAAARVQNAVVSLFRYAGKAVWPAGLSVSYEYHTHWPPFLVMAAAAFAIGLGWIAWTRRRSSPWALAGLAWYGITLLPVIGLVQIGFQSIADRYTYLPLLGLPLAALGGVVWPRTLANRVIITIAGVATLGALGLRTWQQEAVWRDSVALFQHAVTVAPNSDVAEDFLASALVSIGQDETAARHAERAIVLNSDNAAARITLADIRARQGKLAAAAELYRAALALRPNDALVACELGRIEYARGETTVARNLIVSGLQSAPELRPRTLVLARDALARGDLRAAKFLFEALLAVTPHLPEAHAGIGMVDLAQGETSSAFDELRSALAQNPALADAQVAFALCADSLGRHDDATKALAAAVAAGANDSNVLGGVGDVYARRHDFAAAARCYRRAVALAPSNARARVGLGFVLIALGDRAGGADQWRRALQISPEFPGLRAQLEQLEKRENGSD